MALQLSASDYPIKSVTVFKSSKAEVVRTFALHLKVRVSFSMGCALVDVQHAGWTK